MREQYLRLVNDKMLYLTAGVCQSLGERVDLYEWGGVTALVGNDRGLFHAGNKSSGCRGKNICSEELVAFLCGKYGVGYGSRLTVWFPGGRVGSVLFLSLGVTAEEAACPFDGRFQKVELDYRKRHGEWVFIEDNCISFTSGLRRSLPRRLALWGEAGCLALRGDPDGPYALEYRGSRKGDAVYCGQLAEFCKARFGCTARSLLLHAVCLEDGVCFAPAEEDLPRQNASWTPERIDLGLPKDRFARTLQGKSLYLSARGARGLGGLVNVYAAGGFLALKGEADGQFPVRGNQYTHMIHSEALCRAVECFYPAGGKLCLYEHGGLLALVPDASALERLPAPELFRRLDLPGKAPRQTASPVHALHSGRGGGESPRQPSSWGKTAGRSPGRQG